MIRFEGEEVNSRNGWIQLMLSLIAIKINEFSDLVHITLGFVWRLVIVLFVLLMLYRN